MDERCPECGYDYASVSPANAATAIRAEATRLADCLAGADAGLASRRPGRTWSVVQYGGHVRDMLLVQRERVLMARTRSGRDAVPMGRDKRVDWGEYDGLRADQLATEVRLSADWLARTLDLLGADDWSRTLEYNYPQPATRSLSWVAAHTVHEVVHHRRDIEQLLAS